MTTITAVEPLDIRFPTSQTLDGSDAMNTGDYSATYVILHTDGPGGPQGHGMTFTNGRGNELCVAAVQALAHHLVGRDLDEIFDNMAAFWRSLTADRQLRWVGPEKGVIHMATGAVVNAVWDLADLPATQLVSCIDFRYITDALTADEAEDLLLRNDAIRARREAQLRAQGFPAYITSVGWLGYPDDKVRRLCRKADAIRFCQVDSCRLGGVNEVVAVLLMAAKFEVPVCPHAGGVGLAEYVQHLSAFNYLRVGASLDNRVLEYVDHLHEHFVDPVIMDGNRYRLPTAPGYSITMRPESLAPYRFPTGKVWAA